MVLGTSAKGPVFPVFRWTVLDCGTGQKSEEFLLFWWFRIWDSHALVREGVGNAGSASTGCGDGPAVGHRLAAPVLSQKSSQPYMSLCRGIEGKGGCAGRALGSQAMGLSSSNSSALGGALS